MFALCNQQIVQVIGDIAKIIVKLQKSVLQKDVAIGITSVFLWN